MNKPDSPEQLGTGTWVIRLVRSPWPRLGLLLALLGASGWLALTHGAATLSAARGWIAGLGGAGWVLFVAVYALATLVVFPDALLSAAAASCSAP